MQINSFASTLHHFQTQWQRKKMEDTGCLGRLSALFPHGLFPNVSRHRIDFTLAKNLRQLQIINLDNVLKPLSEVKSKVSNDESITFFLVQITNAHRIKENQKKKRIYIYTNQLVYMRFLINNSIWQCFLIHPCRPIFCLCILCF